MIQFPSKPSSIFQSLCITSSQIAKTVLAEWRNETHTDTQILNCRLRGTLPSVITQKLGKNPTTATQRTKKNQQTSHLVRDSAVLPNSDRKTHFSLAPSFPKRQRNPPHFRFPICPPAAEEETSLVVFFCFLFLPNNNNNNNPSEPLVPCEAPWR